MRRYSLLLFLIAAAWVGGDHPMSAQPGASDPCPLKYQRNPEAANRARVTKKQQMRERGVPERYLSLLDKMECVECIETAPAGLHITVLYNDDEHAPTLSHGGRDLKVEVKWSAQGERQLRDQLRAGQIRAFYVWIHEKRCNCCPDMDKTAESYADWDDEIGLNMGEAVAYDDPGDLGALPDDLKPPPSGTQLPVPPLERFEGTKPRQRHVQVTCPACQGLADQWNQESSNLNFLWDRKIEQMRRVSAIANARANRQNEIANLEYQQRFDSSRSYDRGQKIQELKKVNEDQESDQDAAEGEVERIAKEIADTEMRMEALMQKMHECEKECQKTTTALATGAGGPIVTDTPVANAGNPPPVNARPEPVQQSPPSPAPAQPPALCPTCDAAAAELARLNAQIQTRAAELSRLRAQESGNTANLDNLVQLRADAAGRANSEARVAELEGRIAELQAANAQLRAQQFALQQAITQLNEAAAKAIRNLDACNMSCAAATDLPITGGGMTGTGRSQRTVVVNPISAVAKCKECEPLANQLRTEHQRLEDLARRANDLQIDSEFAEFEEQRAKVEDLQKALDECNARCTTQATELAAACTAANDCLPLDACSGGACGGAPSWSSAVADAINAFVQVMGAETPGRQTVAVTIEDRAQHPNPLGLLSRSASEFMEFWMPTLHAAEQGLRGGVQFLITSQGGSTGRNLAMQVLNFTGKPVQLDGMLALEPLKKEAQQRVTQAFTKVAGRRLAATVDLNGFCFEFLKLPPGAGQLFQVAGPEAQKRFAPMKQIMTAANRVIQRGQLNPDSNPDAYATSIKQWALWTFEQKFDEKRFADALLDHTKKAVQGGGQQWSNAAEDMIRKASPNRWRDVVKVLQGAGVAVPQ